MIGRSLVGAMLLLLTFGLANVYAADPAEIDLQNYDLRMEFLENSLEGGAKHAAYWQNGWTTFYAGSALAQTVLWIDSNKNDDSVNYAVGTLKSVAGLADILMRPHPGRHGAQPISGWSQALPEQRGKHLAQGEMMLENSAVRAASRYTWPPHLKVIGLNIFSGALIAAFGDEEDALASTALGIAIGEANIWSQPTRAEAAWREYPQRFPGSRSGEDFSWQLVPIVGGLAVQGRF